MNAGFSLKQCRNCGVEIPKLSGESVARYMNRRTFCSRSCRSLYDRTEAAQARKVARSMRKSACENCGSTERLVAHHQDRNPLNNSPDNVQTLCVPCHNWHHAAHRTDNGDHIKCRLCKLDAIRNGLCNTHSMQEYRRCKREQELLHYPQNRISR